MTGRGKTHICVHIPTTGSLDYYSVAVSTVNARQRRLTGSILRTAPHHNELQSV